MRLRTPLVTLIAAAPLLLAGLTAMRPGVATADTNCSSWNGAQPSSGTRIGELDAVAALSPCDVWAVGFGADGKISQGLITHWTGSSWAIVPSPSPASVQLSGISAVSATDIWVVGISGDTSAHTLILHWDGSAWTRVPSPNPGGNARLFAVDALSATDAWAVGATGAQPNDFRPLTLHWDGSAWTEVPAPDVPAASISVSASAGNDAWAVLNTVPSPTMIHWNGSAWTQFPIQDPGHVELASVAALSANNAWLVGSHVTNGVPQTLIEHWDGTGWTQVPSPNPAGSTETNVLGSIAASSANDVWATGSVSSSAVPPGRPLVLHWDGSSWTVMAAPGPAQGTGFGTDAVGVAGPGQAWLAGFSSDFTGLYAAPVPVVPAVNGDLVGESFATLATYGLRGGHVNHTTDCPASSSGLIIGSDPAAGQIEPAGTAVDVVQCATPATVTVPNVLSWDDTSAQNAIRAAGLTVGTISWDNRCLAERGAVLVQSPNGDTQATPGSAVNLTESSGRTPQNKPCGGTQA
jgi:PASTA domain